MIKKKTLLTIVSSIMLVSLSFAIAIIPTAVADNPCTVHGYVFDQGSIVQPEDVILTIANQTIYALIPGDPTGYYVIQPFNTTIGDVGFFTVVIYGQSYSATETLKIKNGVFLYKINLTINTSGTPVNNPPYTPSRISPGSSTTDTTPNLRWNGGDPDGDNVTYDVYFGNTSPPPLVGNQSGTTYSTGALDYETYYWKIVAWDEHGASAEGSVWQFIVKQSSNGGNGGGSGGGDVIVSPTADANGPYSGFIDEEITFDGSGSTDSDGTITNYTWNFGDGNTGYEETTTHAYSSPGPYTVTLTVTDNDEATDTDVTTVNILVPNIRPEKPTVITGTHDGNITTTYEFTFVSTDADNDSIQYTIDWGDGSDIETTDFVPNGTQVTLTHNWGEAGNFTIKVTAYDNETQSETTEYLVSIEGEEEPAEPTPEEVDYTWLILLLILIIILLILIYLISKRKKPEEKKQPPKKSSGKSGKKKK